MVLFFKKIEGVKTEKLQIVDIFAIEKEIVYGNTNKRQ